MNPHQQIASNNHDGRSKRRRTDDDSPPMSPSITRLVGTRDHSPIVAASAEQMVQNPSEEDDSSVDLDHLATQSPSIHTAAGLFTPKLTPSEYARSSNADDDEDESSDTSDGHLLETTLQAQPPETSALSASNSPPPVYYAKTQRYEDLASIPQDHKDIITAAIAELYPSIETRDFQIEGTNHLAFNDDATLIMIRRTADGKSLVPLTTSYIRKGVTIMMVPLHGLGSDQVEKAISEEHNVEAYYVDEHRSANAQSLRRRLMRLTKNESEQVSIILFVSPMSLLTKSHWIPEFQSLARRGLISLLGIDEAHSVEQSGRSFRKEFVEAAENLNNIVTYMDAPVPRLAMSATFRHEDMERLQHFLGDNAFMMHGPLDRRATDFKCLISGNPARTMIGSAERDIKAHPHRQQLWYGNSKSNCEGTMLDRGDKMIDDYIRSNGGQAICTSFTGGDGMKIKSPIMDAFTSFSRLPGEAIFHADGSVTLPRILILTATSATNCGISSNDLTNVKHKGFPANLYDLVQELGRANRTQDLPDCKYEIHCSFDCVVSSYIRIMQNDSAAERKILMERHMEVVNFLVCPEVCYHTFIEQYFEWTAGPRRCCGNMCSYCRDECGKFTGVFYHRQVTSVISSLFRQHHKVTAAMLKKEFKANKSSIFHPNFIPKSSMKQIHALLLQLFAKGIICLNCVDNGKVGTKKFGEKDVCFQLGYSRDDMSTLVPTYMITRVWEGLSIAQDSTE